MAQAILTPEDREAIRTWIKTERRKMGVTPEQLAIQHLGMTSGRLVSKWESGRTVPGGGYMLRLQRLFGSSPRLTELTAQKVLESGWPRPMELTEQSAPLPSVLTPIAA